jgi:hypothetical protein
MRNMIRICWQLISSAGRCVRRAVHGQFCPSCGEQTVCDCDCHSSWRATACGALTHRHMCRGATRTLQYVPVRICQFDGQRT